VIHVLGSIRRNLDQWLEGFAADNPFGMEGVAAVLMWTKDLVIDAVSMDGAIISEEAVGSILASFATIFSPYSFKSSCVCVALNRGLIHLA
jgi:hypothetical protein